MDPDYALGYRELWERHWWWRARKELVLDTIRRAAPRSGGAVLDVGCGAGLFFDELRQFGDVEGIEPDASLARATSWRDRIRVAPFDESLTLDKRYELILMLDVLEHMDRPNAALRHAARHLTDRGAVVITVPALPALWTNHDEINEHRLRYTKAGLRALATAAGLELGELRFFFHWTALLKLVIRAYESVVRPPPRVPGVPPRWLNELLLQVSRAEQQWLGPVRLPFGSSLLAVGRVPVAKDIAAREVSDVAHA